MGKISRYLVLLCLLGVAIVGFWVYTKYFQGSEEDTLQAAVVRGDIEELVQARGEVVAGREYKLEFGSSGIIEAVYVREGDTVRKGDPLMKLDTNELAAQKAQFQALVAQREADVAKLSAGGSAADIAVARAKVTSAESTLAEAQRVELLALRAVASAMDDAVHGTTDQYYNNPLSAQPHLKFSTTGQIEYSLENERVQLEPVITRAFTTVPVTTASLKSQVDQMQVDAARVGAFLDLNSLALAQGALSTVSASELALWQSATAAARTALNTKTSALASAEEARVSASTNLALVQQQLASLMSPARPEDIAAARALLAEAQAQVRLVDEKLAKATLSAPADAEVVDIGYHSGEAFRTGVAAVVIHALVPKVQSDISELDIAKVSAGLPARITFDALPGRVFEATVANVEPQKVTKDDDTFYRVNFALAHATSSIRAGMSADVNVVISQRHATLKVPAYAIVDKDGSSFARVRRQGSVIEIPVTLGASDGNDIEVLSGLAEGEQVIVPTE